MPVHHVPGAATRSVATHERRYTVRTGDNLSAIAYACHVKLDDLLAANPQIRDPNKIQPGMELAIPSNSTAAELPTGVEVGEQDAFYMVRNGDSLSAIASRHGVDLQSLLAANPQIRNPDLIQPNDRIRLPGDASTRGALGGINAHAAFETAPADATRVDTGPRPAFEVRRYAPFSEDAYALFAEAAQLAGVPESWARSPGLHNILRRESDGKVGIPNYTYGSRSRDPARWSEVHGELKRGVIRARSSCTGLGQLKLDNVERHYPDGRAGIGDPLNEAAGMLSYIKSRYGSPERAWQLYGVYHEGY